MKRIRVLSDDERKIEAEFICFERLITKIHPSGIVSLVADSFDYWSVVTSILPRLKQSILARDGKLVIRPDSGDPVKIVGGMTNQEIHEYERINDKLPPEAEVRGSIEILWGLFGGTVNSKGYKVLDSHIGLIYGDSITLERANEICRRLEAKGFASSNVVFGVGSYSYQYVTRDTYGWAVKATWAQINGQANELSKDPKTDNGMKKSLKGLLKIEKDFSVVDQQTESNLSAFHVVFENGKLFNETTLQEIRNSL